MKRLALDVFHHKVEDAVFRLAEIRNADGIRMLDRSGSLGLAFKTHDSLALLEVFAVQDVVTDGLDGDLAGVKFVVFREKNIAHRAAAQTALQQYRPSSNCGPRMLPRVSVPSCGHNTT